MPKAHEESQGRRTPGKRGEQGEEHDGNSFEFSIMGNAIL